MTVVDTFNFNEMISLIICLVYAIYNNFINNPKYNHLYHCKKDLNIHFIMNL